ncbi:MAG: hypothetical protein DI603_17405 [Roseateles depolymerans]|uniref:Phytase-like domain-containing protein n=1 Tax=Roseateles depolymerans TaxID=76731 RepID=A0A2W5FIK0_9BURK|nr:MAG: hypothetical protein DI603_17405 [Roseateles depolymerans]
MKFPASLTPALLPALLLALGTSVQAQSLTYLGQQVLPSSETYKGTPVGGLSSLDYDVAHGRYLAISDDRSELAPARFYEFTLDLSKFNRNRQPGRAGVQFTGVTTLLNPQGQPFGPRQLDPEGLRLDARRGLIYWSNEGQRRAGDMQSPTIRRMKPDGQPAGEFPVPPYYFPSGSAAGRSAGDLGVYDNLGFESIAITPDGRTLWTMVENALAQDDAPAALDHGSRARMLSFDLDSGRAGAEYIYEVGPVPVTPAKPGAFSVNGVADMLALSDHEFIAIERGFAVGAPTPGASPVNGKPTGNSIQLVLIDTQGATDVAGWASIQGRALTPVKRRLLLDLSTLKNDDGSPLALDNVEGLVLGPQFNGKPTLVLVSDNNFSAEQFTQFLLLSIDGPLTGGARP